MDENPELVEYTKTIVYEMFMYDPNAAKLVPELYKFQQQGIDPVVVALILRSMAKLG